MTVRLGLFSILVLIILVTMLDKFVLEYIYYSNFFPLVLPVTISYYHMKSNHIVVILNQECDTLLILLLMLLLLQKSIIHYLHNGTYNRLSYKKNNKNNQYFIKIYHSIRNL